ncbi:hypothetical protein L226DRAFT_534866 [Lentinus tigrinus ALCF2SS1-7]|uniref:4a-hydroxytetrahydrobiopterin dehydratase n=1 Tax=Lentinus tigrinus ALCF2SS1-6 TaxID=1328759 RepID=A0A5C2SBP2_9APHY|nr:hypothetical protein L227DRAFT_574839 [Lentinus tigrinus ALCF2SS1-6]RPD75297.1 hypothetical protein L226DRAFT_534866 [Lentinus tigrinus ALCF2SS1-7]
MLALPSRTSNVYVRSYRSIAGLASLRSSSSFCQLPRTRRTLPTASTPKWPLPAPGHHITTTTNALRNIIERARTMSTETRTRKNAGGTSDSAEPPVPPPGLPDLPPAPSYPCPFLTDEEIMTYLDPLYLKSWTVQASNPGQSKNPAPELVKRFEFSSQPPLHLFLNAVNEIESKENHHCIQETSTTAVTIRVHTHSGLRPASHPEEPRKGRISPGITLRDIRFAYLLEAVADGQKEPRLDVTPEEQPHTAKAVEARRQKTSQEKVVG